MIVTKLGKGALTRHMRNIQKLTAPTNIFTYYLKDMTGTLKHKYRNDFLQRIKASGSKEPALYGLGNTIFLSLPAWRQVSKPWLQKRSLGRNLKEKIVW